MISNDQLNEFRKMADEGDEDLPHIVTQLVDECQAYAALLGGLIEFKNKLGFEEILRSQQESRKLLDKLVESIGSP